MQRQHRIKKVSLEYLRRVALWYLERFSSSILSLRKALLRRVEKSVQVHGTDKNLALEWVETVIQECQKAGYLNDSRYAEAKIHRLHQKGWPLQRIRQSLKVKGVNEGDLNNSLQSFLDGKLPGDIEKEAIFTYAKRRRIGPFRPPHQRLEYQKKDLANLARAGFSWGIAQLLIQAPTPEDFLQN